jgi:hypothetical protein
MADAIRLAGDIDPDLCRATARQRFSLEAMASSYFALYERLVRHGSARAFDGAA